MAFAAIFSISTYVYYNCIPIAIRSYIKKAADENNNLAQIAYAVMCWNEIGRPSSISYKEDCRIARTYLKKCSDDNNEEADLILATAYFEGKLGTDKNLPLAKYHAEKAVNTRFLDEDTKRPIKELLKEINSQLEKEEKTFLPPPQPDVIQQNRAQVIAPERLQQLERAAEAIEEIIEQERGTIALITLFIQAYRFTNSKLEYYLTRTRFF